MAGLQRQIKQPKPFRSVHEEAFLNLLRTSAGLVAGLNDLLRPYDLTQPQYNVLRILRGARGGALPCGEVGARMVARGADVTGVLDRMEARGLVVREPDPTDPKTVTARLSPDGLYVVNALDEPMHLLHVRQLGHVAEDELRSLNALLERVRAAGSPAPAPPGPSGDG